MGLFKKNDLDGNMGFTRKDADDPSLTIGLKYFTMNEHQCKCGKCEFQKCHVDLYPMLDEVRHILGLPLVVNSGYRCPTHNKKVGGTSRSKHLEGLAVDVATLPMKHGNATTSMIYRLAKIGEDVGFTGIGIYRSWVHFDIRPTALTMWGPKRKGYLKYRQ